jgi:hypothetical protein
MRKNDAIMEILSPYAPDEITAAERKLELYPAWKRLLRVMDSIFEVSFKDPYSDRVQGGVSLPQAEKIIMLKECHPEYQRVQRNIAAIERGLMELSSQELDFVARYWWNDTFHRGDHRQWVADSVGWGRNTVDRWWKRCLVKLMPYLEDADTILIRARWVEEWSEEKNGTRSPTPSCGI